MAKRQHRRSISITAESYARTQLLAEKSGRSVSGIVEDLLRNAADAAGIRAVTREEARGAPTRPTPNSDTHGGGHFTF
jgi:hypothetical protein